jgi:hypothetical protein
LRPGGHIGPPLPGEPSRRKVSLRYAAESASGVMSACACPMTAWSRSLAVYPSAPETAHRGRISQVILKSPESITQALYRLVAELPRHRFPVPRSLLPTDGIYLILENGEMVTVDEQMTDRIVRVGTHTADGRLARRLRGHSSGNRRASVFRTHIGAALLERANPGDNRLETWIHQRRTRMPEIELTVTDYIRQSLSISCIPVPTKAERLWLERGLIALLAAYPLAQPSSTWLGHHSYHPVVRQSGLWNSQHVRAEPLSEFDLATVAQRLAASQP